MRKDTEEIINLFNNSKNLFIQADLVTYSYFDIENNDLSVIVLNKDGAISKILREVDFQ